MIRASEAENNSVGKIFPDMTALLDVIFILLVFLLLTANVVPQVLEVDLPQESEATTASAEVNNQISITMFAGGERWGLGAQEYTDWGEIEAALVNKISKLKNPEIIVAGDKQVPLEKLVKLFSWLQSKNLNAAKIMVEQ